MYNPSGEDKLCPEKLNHSTLRLLWNTLVGSLDVRCCNNNSAFFIMEKIIYDCWKRGDKLPKKSLRQRSIRLVTPPKIWIKMRKLILALLLIAPLANAQLTLEDCHKVEKNSATLMKLRQQGVEYSHMYRLAEGNKLIISMINHAYDDWPQFHSETLKQRAVNEYKEYYFRSCVKNVSVD